jgi:hypothetical protein
MIGKIATYAAASAAGGSAQVCPTLTTVYESPNKEGEARDG